jgi:hypothetical protein
MMWIEKRSRRNLILVLILLLSVQLTGLTCIQDLGGSSIKNNSTAFLSSVDDPSPESFPPSSDHDCPCHHVVTYFSGFMLTSALFTDTLAVPVGSTVDDNPPQAIFHPPVVLS